MNFSKNKIRGRLTLLTLVMLLILPMIAIQPVSGSQAINFEGITWEKQIRERSSTGSQSYYSSEANKVSWNNNGELTALESSATYLRWVGFSLSFQATSSGSISFNADVKVTAGHSSPRKMYAAVFYENAQAYNEWEQVGSSQLLTSSSTYSKVYKTFTGMTPGERYELFFFYSDGWSSDWNTKIYLKNMDIGSSGVKTGKDAPLLIVSSSLSDDLNSRSFASGESSSSGSGYQYLLDSLFDAGYTDVRFIEETGYTDGHPTRLIDMYGANGFTIEHIHDDYYADLSHSEGYNYYSSGHSSGKHGQSYATQLGHVSWHLASYISKIKTSYGYPQPVNIIAWSGGGVIVAEMMYQILGGNSDFPTTDEVQITNFVASSSPLDGMGYSEYQCDNIADLHEWYCRFFEYLDDNTDRYNSMDYPNSDISYLASEFDVVVSEASATNSFADKKLRYKMSAYLTHNEMFGYHAKYGGPGTEGYDDLVDLESQSFDILYWYSGRSGYYSTTTYYSPMERIICAAYSTSC